MLRAISLLKSMLVDWMALKMSLWIPTPSMPQISGSNSPSGVRNRADSGISILLEHSLFHQLRSLKIALKWTKNSLELVCLTNKLDGVFGRIVWIFGQLFFVIGSDVARFLLDVAHQILFHVVNVAEERLKFNSGQ